MSFDLGVWNGMSDTERMRNLIRVMGERDEAQRLLRGMLSIENSVTQGQERERRAEFVPQAIAYFRATDRESAT